MKKRMWTRIISGALVGAMMMTMFTGCDNKKEEEYVEGEASEVSFNTDGKFTTTLTAENGNYSEDIAAGDVKIAYNHLDQEAYEKALAEEGDVEESKIDYEKYVSQVDASVDSVTRKDEHTLEITFTDAKAAENTPDSYGILVNKEKSGTKYDLVAAADVAYIEHTLTPNIESVSAFDKDIRLTLELDEGEYADGVSKEDVTLSGSFANLTVADLSAAGKNLTMQLTGDIIRDEYSNAYLSGGVSLAPSAVVNGAKAMEVYLPVDDVMVYLDASKLTAENGKATVPVVLGGYRFTDKAAAGSFKLDGATVIDFEKTGDTEGVLTLTISGAKDKNSAAAALDNKTLTVAADAADSAEDLSVELELSSAAFYPVFDYAEEKDGKYNITLKLYANSGTFAESLENGMVSFADDFEKAAVTSITRENDATAELKITLPSGGVSVEEMNLNGTVKLAADALVNRWGDKAAETAYTREYSQESMGRILTDMEIGQIKDIVGGFGNTTWGTISSVGGGIISGVSGVYSALEIIGVIESEKAKLDKIYASIMKMHDELSALSTMVSSEFDKLNGNITGASVGSFYTDKLMMMNEYRRDAMNDIRNAQANLKKQGINPPTSNDYSDAWKEYLTQVMETVKNSNSNNFSYLQNYFTNVYTSVTVNGNGNVLDTFDKYMTYYYNFESQTYAEREEFRTAIQFEMMNAYLLLRSYYEYGEHNEFTVQELNSRIEKMNSVMKQKEVKRRGPDKYGQEQTYMYAANCMVWLKLTGNVWNPRTGLCYREWSDAMIGGFNQRMRHSTILQEFKSVGFNIKEGRDKLAITYSSKRKDCVFYYKYSYELTYCMLSDKSVNKNGHADDSSKKADNLTRHDTFSLPLLSS